MADDRGIEPRSTTRSTGADQAGSALIWALLFVVIVSGMVISHSIFLASHRRSNDVRYTSEALAANFARSGLVDALGWFRRQSAQPVLSFSPAYDPVATPPIFDTVDPGLGLVREFEISQSLWGRYEVRHSEVLDISTERGMTTPGSAWELGVRAYVYRRSDPNQPFDVKPNRIVSATTMSTEMRGVPIQIPMLAALNIDDITKLTISGTDVVIDGGGKPGVAYDDAEAVPVLPPDGSIAGTPAQSGSTGLDTTSEAIFGMPITELQSFSDVIVRTDADRTGQITGEDQIISVVNLADEYQGFVLDECLLVVDGNLHLMAGSQSFINGVVFVTGNLKSLGDMTVNGAVIVGNDVELQGKSEIHLDEALITRLAEKMQQYRLPRTFTPK